jgi:hypothetical protein
MSTFLTIEMVWQVYTKIDIHQFSTSSIGAARRISLAIEKIISVNYALQVVSTATVRCA